MPERPTIPTVIKRGCQEKNLHSPAGSIAVRYPPMSEKTSKTSTNNQYMEEDGLGGFCWSNACVEAKMRKKEEGATMYVVSDLDGMNARQDCEAK